MPIPQEIARSQTIPFANVASGWHPFAPARSLDPERGPCWRKVVNFRWHDGVLEKRRSVVRANYALNDVVIDRETDASQVAVFGYPESGRTEYPMWMNQVEATAEADTGQAAAIATILVTSSDIYILDPGAGWSVATPIYNTGTIDVTSGSATIVGTGTTWQTDNIAKNASHIVVGGKWLTITQVVSDTEMEVNPAPDITDSGIPYTIRRGFQAQSDDSISNNASIYVTMHNGDLYVAGTNCGGPNTPAVIRVRHFTSDPQPGQYLMASKALDPAIDVFENLLEINGMVNLPDGRVMLATTELDPDSSGSGEEWLAQSRLRYSSHLDVFEWVEEPGGFLDDVSGGAGKITALAPFGRAYTVHYRDAISLATLTGQDEPPVALQATRSHVGTGAYRTIRLANGNQLFVGHDGAIYRFNGLYTEQVSNAFRDQMQAFQRNAAAWWLFSMIDEYRDEYQVFMRDRDAPKDQTECFVVNFKQRFAPRWEIFPVAFWCASEKFLGAIAADGLGNSTRQWGAGFGVTRIVANGDSVVRPFFRFREFFPEDVVDEIDHTINDLAERIELQTDDLHFGWPGQHQVIESFHLWLRMRPDAIINSDSNKDTKDGTAVDDISVDISSDGGNTWSTAKTAQVTYQANNRHTQQQVQFTFEDVPSGEQHRIRIRSDNYLYLYGQIEGAAIKIQTLGEAEGLSGGVVRAA